MPRSRSVYISGVIGPARVSGGVVASSIETNMSTAPKCLKCGTEMEAGFIPGETSKVVTVTRWVAGRPEPSFWVGTKIRGKEQHGIITYRCPSCGFLESYATEIAS